MIVYHDGKCPIKKPEIIKREYGRDFGAGFYTTDIKEQAIRWAIRRAKIENRKGGNAHAIVSIYDIDESCYQSLNVIHFPEPSMEWLDMVCKCRSDIDYTHGYDIVTGKIANDSVGQTVQYVVQGIMRREDALERLRFEKINNQICFCTEKALSFLQYKCYEEV